MLHNTASLVTLISSNSRASLTSAFPAAQSSLSTWPTIVEVHRVTPYLSLLRANGFYRPEDHFPRTTQSNPRGGVARRFNRLPQSTRKHRVLTPAPSSQSRLLLHIRLSSGYSRSPEVKVHSFPPLYSQEYTQADRPVRFSPWDSPRTLGTSGVGV